MQNANVALTAVRNIENNVIVHSKYRFELLKFIRTSYMMADVASPGSLSGDDLNELCMKSFLAQLTTIYLHFNQFIQSGAHTLLCYLHQIRVIMAWNY